MDLPYNLYPDTAGEAPIGTSVLVVACISVSIVLILAALTCICCHRTRGGSFSDNRRDTVPLDDLLSKPSLADPESVFSEAGSYEFPRPARSGSWLRLSGEDSNVIPESLSLSATSNDEKDRSNYHSHSGQSYVLDVQSSNTNKENIQNYKHVKTEHAQFEQQDSHQRHSGNNKTQQDLAPHNMQTVIQCARLDHELTHEVGRCRKISVPHKVFSHKNISGKVGLDSSSLQIHRDSVTPETAPFLSSTRCSFSHEVGHIVHGNKIPRTSLPRTEETEDCYSKSSFGFNNTEEYIRGDTELSFQVGTGHNKTSSSENIVINERQQTIAPKTDIKADKSQHGDFHPINQIGNPQHMATPLFTNSETHNTSISNTPLLRVNKNNTSCLIEDPNKNHHGPVPMRRCLSWIYDDQVCMEQLARPHRKTFSLNLKIDVHFESIKGSNENFSTLVCTPLTEYSQCDKHEVRENCDQRSTSDVLTKDITSSSFINTNQISDKMDENSKEKLLQKSFELKYNNLGRESLDFARKRRSEPTFENSALKNCNIRHVSRFSETESPNMAAYEMVQDQSICGRQANPDTGAAGEICSTANNMKSQSYVTRIRQGVGDKSKFSSSYSGPVAAQRLTEINTDLKNDATYSGVELGIQADHISNSINLQQSTRNSPSIRTTFDGSKNANTSVNNDGDKVTNEIASCLVRNDFKNSSHDQCLKSETQVNNFSEEAQLYNEKHLSSSTRSSETTMTTADFKMNKNSASCHGNCANTNTITTMDITAADVSAVVKDYTINTTTESVSRPAECTILDEGIAEHQSCVPHSDIAPSIGASTGVSPSIGAATGVSRLIGSSTAILPSEVVGSGVSSSIGISTGVSPSIGVSTAILPSEIVGSGVSTSVGITTGVSPSIGASTGVLSSEVVSASVSPSNSVLTDIISTEVVISGVSPSIGVSTGVSPSIGVSTCVSPSIGVSTVVSPSIGVSTGVSPSIGVSTGVSPSIGVSTSMSPTIGISTGVSSSNNVLTDILPTDVSLSVSPSNTLPCNILPLDVALTSVSPSDVRVVSSVQDCHRRTQTLRERYGWVHAATATEAIHSHSQRATSLKIPSTDTQVPLCTTDTQVPLCTTDIRAPLCTMTSGKNQQHRKAILFHDLLDISKSFSSDGEHVNPSNNNNNPSGINDSSNINKHISSKSTMEESNIQEGRQQIIQQPDQGSDNQNRTQGSVHKQMNIVTLKHGSDDSLTESESDIKGTVEHSGFYKKRKSMLDEENQISSQEKNRCTVTINVQSESCASITETSEVSDDSDYDNPWDNLDDAVKRASIRYNRRPSRIAAGDTKTLLLKSAEDLGRLMEEAEKRRQLRQARNSCQVTSPEIMTDSMTIPLTRFSPYRHTVKGLTSQPHMSTSHSSEDMLETHNLTSHKLNLLRQEDGTDSCSQGIDTRRPMSLASKVKSKISSPEMKQRKK